jgi:hypothetical protein
MLASDLAELLAGLAVSFRYFFLSSEYFHCFVG